MPNVDTRLLSISLRQVGAGSAEDIQSRIEDAQMQGAPDILAYLVQTGFIDHELGDRVYAMSRGWQWIPLVEADLDETLLAMISPAAARELTVVPVSIDDGTVTFACADPGDAGVERDLQREMDAVLGSGGDGGTFRVKLAYADPEKIRSIVNSAYSAGLEASRLLESGVGVEATLDTSSSTADLGDLSSGNSEVEKLLQLTVEQAVRDRASDIHIEPTLGGTIIRYRVDGVLRRSSVQSRAVGDRMVALIKTRALMRADENRRGQDGVLEQSVSGKKVTIRAVTLPGVHGEDVVMRLQADMSRPLESLGFTPSNLELFRAAISQPYGMVIVTGPTGSGKSTTLYSALGEVSSETTKIITVEDPVETRMPPGITQMPVKPEIGWTFEKALRSILRGDPDIILLGEIRDEITAKTAVDAAMTGHLMLSTLHTNTAPSALDRLIELGVAPSMAGESLLQVLAQRLVRRLCDHCRVPFAPTPGDLDRGTFGWVRDIPEVIYSSGGGCQECRGTGYSGRVSVNEVMNLNDEIRSIARKRVPVAEIAAAARRNGMTSLREDGWSKVAAGITDMQEINRVIAHTTTDEEAAAA